MPIDDGKGRGGVDSSLRWFTDRAQLIRRFLDYIYGPSPIQKVLYFWGDGGNGKSKLLNMLSAHFCKYLPGVEQGSSGIEHETYEELRRRFEGGEADKTRRVVTSFLDFDALPQGEDNPKEAFSALFMLRRALGSKGIKFPRFDYAVVVYLLKNNKFTPDKVTQLFPNDDYELVSELVNLLGDMPGLKQLIDTINLGRKAIDLGKKALAVVGKYTSLEDKTTAYWTKKGLDKATVERIKGMDAEFGKELYNELPGLFAADLNEAIGKVGGPSRIVLFFDTLEALNRQDRNAAGLGFFRTDEWLRRLVRGLALEKGIVVVVAGRDKLRWPDAPEFEVGAEYLDVRKVEQFSDADAGEYLRKREVADEGLRKAIITYASTGRDEIHPLLLGMAADVLELAAGKGEALGVEDFRDAPDLDKKEQLLINRMLRYMDDTEEFAVKALSVCRTFDYEIYKWLGEKLDFEAKRPLFERLVKYSFVTSIQGGDGQEQYRIHGLLRRLMFEHGDGVVRAADEVMEAYYRGKVGVGNELAVVEAIYHTNRLDWESGVVEWVREFDAANLASRHELCEALLDLRSTLITKNSLGSGFILIRHANYSTLRSRFEQAEESYRQAIQAFDKALSLDPTDPYSLNNIGYVIQSLGNLQAKLSKTTEAQESYRQAIQAFDKALSLDPTDLHSLNNIGKVLQRIGFLQAKLSKTTEAQESYFQAIQICDKVLSLAPDDLDALNNKGIVCVGLGELQAKLSKFKEAEESYFQAIQICDKVLFLAPDDLDALYIKRDALRSLGELQAKLSKFKEAEESYFQAIQICDQSLSLAPDDLDVLNFKGDALRSFGELQVELSKLEEAEESYFQAIQICDKVLSLAPDDLDALNTKGIVWITLGKLEIQLSKLQEAEESCAQAIQAFDKALSLDPINVQILTNKGNVLTAFGELQVELSKFKEAEESYFQAIQICDKVLSLAPNNMNALNNKGNALTLLGDLQSQLLRWEEAEYTFAKALKVYDTALSLASDDIMILHNKGLLLQDIGYFQVTRFRMKDAEESYIQAIQVFDKTLSLAPDFVLALNNMSLTLLRASRLLSESSYNGKACVHLDLAKALCIQSIRIAPNDERVTNLLKEIEVSIREMCETSSVAK